MKLFNIIMLALLWVTMLVWLIGIIAPMKRQLNEVDRKVSNLYEVLSVGAKAPNENLLIR